MQRRKFLQLAALTAGAATLQAARAQAFLTSELATPKPSDVTRVLVVFKCHLDVGFTDTQAKVLGKYFEVYYPQAISTASLLRAAGADRYIWTTGSYLLYQYLEQANAEQRRKIEQAIAAGDITWHALPFTWQTEMLDPSMIHGALSLSATLDQRFGHKTVGAKMSDVVGHSRGIISPLAAAGVKLLDIGVNGATRMPETPPIFSWRDQNNASIVTIYHPQYGGTIQIPGTTTAFAMEMASDNAGPHSLADVKAIYARLRAQFPNAVVVASNLNEVALETDAIRDRLPLVTQEIGDTWIHGIPSDPLKVAQYREISRARRQWLAEKKFSSGDAVDRQFLLPLLLAVEHTWGTDTMSYLDYNHYTIPELNQALADPKLPGYKTMTISWQEKRDDITQSVAALPPRLEAQLNTRLKQLSSGIPSREGMSPLPNGTAMRSRHYIVEIDPRNGSIIRLKNNKTGKDWASPDHPLAIFTYQTLSAEDFDHFLEAYTIIKADWVPKELGKPNIGRCGAVSKEWHPTLVHAWSARVGSSDRVLLELKIDDQKAFATGTVAWPTTIYLELTLPDKEPTISLRLSTFGKIANRLPESMWLTFNPLVKDRGSWEMEKVGQLLTPADVVAGGSRNMHAISENIRCREGANIFEIATLDAPVIAFGQRSPINFSMSQPDLTSGIHINLFNNAWGTNYPQWCSGDWSYRFNLKA